MKTLQYLQNDLSELKRSLAELNGNLVHMGDDPMAYFEDEITGQYNDLLDEQYGEMVNALPFYCGSAADLCGDKDPTFYRCGLNDYADSVDVSSFQEYQDVQEEIETLESDIEDLESEIEDLENEESEED